MNLYITCLKDLDQVYEVVAGATINLFFLNQEDMNISKQILSSDTEHTYHYKCLDKSEKL